MDYKNINIKDIKADDNIRKSIAKESLEGLMQSIKEQGIIQPLVVRKLKDNTFDLIAGFRRLMAAKELNLSNVPCVIRAAENDEIVELQLIENIQRENLNPIDEAKAIQELAKDHTVADLIPMLGQEAVPGPRRSHSQASKEPGTDKSFQRNNVRKAVCIPSGSKGRRLFKQS